MAEKTSTYSKRMTAVRKKVQPAKSYSVDEALKLVKETATAKFDESVDVAVNLGVDAKKSDQTVRGSVVLPAGTGKKVRVAVFAQGDKAKVAQDAGADIVGFQTPQDCAHFLAAVEATVPADVDRVSNTVLFGGHQTRVRAYPVGVEWDNESVRTAPTPRDCRARIESERPIGLLAELVHGGLRRSAGRGEFLVGQIAAPAIRRFFI